MVVLIIKQHFTQSSNERALQKPTRNASSFRPIRRRRKSAAAHAPLPHCSSNSRLQTRTTSPSSLNVVLEVDQIYDRRHLQQTESGVQQLPSPPPPRIDWRQALSTVARRLGLTVEWPVSRTKTPPPPPTLRPRCHDERGAPAGF